MIALLTKFWGRKRNAGGTQKGKRKRSEGEEKNKKENRALTVPKLRGTGHRAIDWMNDLIKYFPSQCIVGFSYNKET